MVFGLQPPEHVDLVLEVGWLTILEHVRLGVIHDQQTSVIYESLSVSIEFWLAGTLLYGKIYISKVAGSQQLQLVMRVAEVFSRLLHHSVALLDS